MSWMTQLWARSESRIRIALDHSLELQSFASSILSVTFDVIGGSKWIGNSWIDAIDFFFSCVVSYWISDLAAVTVLCFFKKKNSFTVCGGRERRGRKEKTKLNEETERKEVLWGSGEGLIMDYTCSRARMSIGSMFSSFLTLRWKYKLFNYN